VVQGVADPPFGKDAKSWQYYSYTVLVLLSTTYYLIGGLIAYKLYKSLKAVFQPLDGEQQIAPGGYPGGMGQQRGNSCL
jgi:hypothetical protein